MTSSQSPILEVSDLSVEFGGGGFSRWRKDPLVAVDSISFQVFPGEALGLVGESGSGKSTTARAVLRLVGVSAGSIRYKDTDITAFGKATPLWYRRSVQAVFQDPASSLNPRHLAGRAVTNSLRRHGVKSESERIARAADAFERVGLSRDHLYRLPNEMSGGQQQRVAIARALALDSDLVVCDEMVSALDLSTQAQIINLLEELQQSDGLSFLFIAHDLAVVRDICDRIVVMYAGRVVEVATKERLFESPKHPYTRALLAASPASHPSGRESRRSRRAAYRSNKSEESPPRGEPGCPFRIRCAHVMDVCSMVTPPLRRLTDGTEVACHLYEEGTRQSDSPSFPTQVSIAGNGHRRPSATGEVSG